MVIISKEFIRALVLNGEFNPIPENLNSIDRINFESIQGVPYNRIQLWFKKFHGTKYFTSYGIDRDRVLTIIAFRDSPVYAIVLLHSSNAYFYRYDKLYNFNFNCYKFIAHRGETYDDINIRLTTEVEECRFD